MKKAPTYKELEKRVAYLEKEAEKAELTEEAYKLNESRLEALLKLNQMTDAPLQKLTDYALEEAVKLTRSDIGYIAFMNQEETVLQMNSWSKNAMKQCGIDIKPRIYPVEATGLWGEAVRLRKPVITNDYSSPNPSKKGYPEGHIKIIRHMNLPVFVSEKIVIVARVGNKMEPYNESDVRQLRLLMQGMWRLIHQKSINWALYDSETKFQKLVDTIGSAVFIFTPNKIKFSNAAAQVITGYSHNELLSMSIFDLVHPDYHGLARELGYTTKKIVDVHYRYGEGKLGRKACRTKLTY